MADSKVRDSILNFPARTAFIALGKSFHEEAVRNPKPPTFTPNIGVPEPAVVRAQCSIVPSPPMTMIRSAKRLIAIGSFRIGILSFAKLAVLSSVTGCNHPALASLIACCTIRFAEAVSALATIAIFLTLFFTFLTAQEILYFQLALLVAIPYPLTT